MTTITLELPEDIAAKAREAGLLAPERLAGVLDEAILKKELRRMAFERFTAAGDRFRQACKEAGEPLPTEEEIVALCKEVRREMTREARGA